MNDEIERPPLSRPIRIEDIRGEVSGDIEATQAERTAIAKILDLPELKALSFSYRLRPGSGGRFNLAGRLAAELVQTCVVSLEPVEASLDVPVEMEFWPAALIDDLEGSAEEPGSAGLLDWPEPIAEGKIDLGPVIYETLATAIDPYPKREGVSFHWSQGEETGDAAGSGPFAALSRFKRR